MLGIGSTGSTKPHWNYSLAYCNQTIQWIPQTNLFNQTTLSYKARQGYNKEIYNTNIHVLYIDSLPDLAINKENEYNDYKSSVLSDVIGRNNSSYSLHRVSIPHKNITILGIDEQLLDDEQEYILKAWRH